MNIRDRIKELRRVPASELRPSPKNWRTHPASQIDALKGVLAEIGFASATLARELPDGSLELIDGHARAEVTGDAPIPVLVLDVTEDEAAKILATFDPLGDLAGADAALLESLLHEVNTSSPALMQMLDDLATKHGVVPPVDEQDEPAGVDEISEKYQILIDFADERTQTEWLEKLAAEGLACKSLIS